MSFNNLRSVRILVELSLELDHLGDAGIGDEIAAAYGLLADVMQFGALEAEREVEADIQLDERKFQHEVSMKEREMALDHDLKVQEAAQDAKLKEEMAATERMARVQQASQPQPTQGQPK